MSRRRQFLKSTDMDAAPVLSLLVTGISADVTEAAGDNGTTPRMSTACADKNGVAGALQ